MILFLFSIENRFSHFMQIVSNEDNLYEMSNLFSGKNKKNILKYHLLKFLPRVNFLVVKFSIYLNGLVFVMAVRMKILVSLAIPNAPSEGSDQTAQMCRLIWVLMSDGTFLTSRLVFFPSKSVAEYSENFFLLSTILTEHFKLSQVARL